MGYSVIVSNTAIGAVDNNSTFVIDPVPANTDLFVGDAGGPGSGPVAFSNGTPPSGLTYTFTSLASVTDDVSFSNDGGVTYNYTPVPNGNGVDPNVTHLRINPKGVFSGDLLFGRAAPELHGQLPGAGRVASSLSIAWRSAASAAPRRRSLVAACAV